MVATNSLMIVAAINAAAMRDVVTLYIPDVFLCADLMKML